MAWSDAARAAALAVRQSHANVKRLYSNQRNIPYGYRNSASADETRKNLANNLRAARAGYVRNPDLIQEFNKRAVLSTQYRNETRHSLARLGFNYTTMTREIKSQLKRAKKKGR